MLVAAAMMALEVEKREDEVEGERDWEACWCSNSSLDLICTEKAEEVLEKGKKREEKGENSKKKGEKRVKIDMKCAQNDTQ